MSIFKNNFFYILGFFFILYGLFFSHLFLYLIFGIYFFLIYKFKSKYIFFLISIIFFTFYLFEIIFKDKILQTDYITKNNISYEVNQDYGYHPEKNRIFKEQIFYKNKLLKKNTYTINKFGHRNFNNKVKLEKCIILHGGSITFGQSLSDNETLSYFVRNLYKEQFNIFNFAFNGYGPHQFLAKLESSHLNEIDHCKDVVIIYQFIYDHVARTAGKRSWGDKSPRYVIEDNKLVKRGFFSDIPFKIVMKLRKNFRHSKVSNIFFNLERINQKDKVVFLNILENIEKLVLKNFNNSKFIYIVWGENLNENEKLFNFFNASKTLFINNLKLNPKILYNNIPGDNHPTKEFNSLIAEKIKIMLNSY